MIGKQTTQDRKTFTVPDGFEAVRDEEGRATGEVRPTQPTTQAIQQAREIAADCFDAKGLGRPKDILTGKFDHFLAVQAALRALSVSASEREALEARVKELEAEKERAFNFGYVLACCNINNLHHDEVIAFDVLNELGVSEEEIIEMDLSEYDTAALRKIESARAVSPYRAALNGATRP